MAIIQWADGVRTVAERGTNRNGKLVASDSTTSALSVSCPYNLIPSVLVSMIASWKIGLGSPTLSPSAQFVLKIRCLPILGRELVWVHFTIEGLKMFLAVVQQESRKRFDDLLAGLVDLECCGKLELHGVSPNHRRIWL